MFVQIHVLPFISTTSTGTCFSLMRKISKLVTTPWEGKKSQLIIFCFFKRNLWHISCLSSFYEYLCSFGSPVNFHTQIIPVSLPVQFAVDDIEEIANADLLTGGHLHQSHPGWDVFVLGYPERYDVVTRRPREVPEDAQTLIALYKMPLLFKAWEYEGLLLYPSNLETLLVQ